VWIKDSEEIPKCARSLGFFARPRIVYQPLSTYRGNLRGKNAIRHGRACLFLVMPGLDPGIPLRDAVLSLSGSLRKAAKLPAEKRKKA